MVLLSRRSMLGIAAVVDIAIHSRRGPVAAKLLAARHNLPPRHLETLLQALVRAGVLRGVRGPRGGYELAQDPRKVTAGDIVRAAMAAQADEEHGAPEPRSRLVDLVISDAVKAASESFLRTLDTQTVEDLCREADARGVFRPERVESADVAV